MKKILFLWLLYLTCLYASDPRSTHFEFSIAFLYSNAHIVVKMVILLLFACSICVWTIFFAKSLIFFMALKRLKAEKKQVKNIGLNIYPKNIKSFSCALYEEINDEISNLTSKINNVDGIINRIKYRLELVCQRNVSMIKRWIAPLATIASISPFIGLFGTVWGIMHSFIGIANAKNASLSVVAPGIAEALFATALGLVVAIPSAIFYNFFIRLKNRFEEELEELSLCLFLMADKQLHSKQKEM